MPSDVLVSELDGESIILNLKTKSYFGLDEISTSVWSVVADANSIEAGFETLTSNWTVDPILLRNHLVSLLEQLVAAGLIELTS